MNTGTNQKKKIIIIIYLLYLHKEKRIKNAIEGKTEGKIVNLILVHSSVQSVPAVPLGNSLAKDHSVNKNENVHTL